MLKFLLKNLFSYKSLFLLFFAANISHCLADSFNLKKIEIIGEQRLSESFIKKFVPNINDGLIDNQELNNLTKKHLKFVKNNKGIFSDKEECK